MSNNFIAQQLNLMKADQAKAVQQLTIHEAAIKELKNVLQDRAVMIKMMEAILDPSKKESTIGQVIYNR